MQAQSAEGKSEEADVWIRLLQQVVSLQAQRAAAIESVKKSTQANKQASQRAESEARHLRRSPDERRTEEEQQYRKIKQLCVEVQEKSELLELLTRVVFDLAIGDALDRETDKLQRVSSELVVFS